MIITELTTSFILERAIDMNVNVSTDELNILIEKVSVNFLIKK